MQLEEADGTSCHVTSQTAGCVSEQKSRLVYLQRLHGQVRRVVVVDLPGVAGSFFMQIVRRLQARREERM